MTNITMAVVGNLSPVLFLTFRSLYGISYSLLGALVLINFCTQLGVDLIFSFFSHKFNIPLTVKCTPIIAVVGLVFFALSPLIFPSAVFVGLVIGTVIFSASSGLAEVLISPVIAALPADNPDREMSKLHAVYAWGAVGAAVCYLLAVFVNVPVVGLLACGLTGICVSMMWPGSLVVAADRFPKGGVVVYAMMAAGGDLGASVAPQLVGVVTDAVSASP